MKSRFDKWYARIKLDSSVQGDDFVEKARWVFDLTDNIKYQFQKELHLVAAEKLLSFLKDHTIDELKNLLLNRASEDKNHLPNIFFGANEFSPSLIKEASDKLESIISGNIKNEYVYILPSLNTTENYYSAQKSIIRYLKENPSPDNVDEFIKTHLRGYLDIEREESKEAFKRLKNDVVDMIEKKELIDFRSAIEKISHTILLASTAKGSLPYIKDVSGSEAVLDFWGVTDKFKTKVSKNRFFVFKQYKETMYGGVDNIKEGVDYIEKKVPDILKSVDIERALELVEDNVKGKLSKNDAPDITKYFLSDIIETISNIKIKNNAMLNALLSIAHGYQKLLNDSNDEITSTDKIILLLIYQQIHALIKKFPSEEDEKKLNLMYTSCIDLMCVAVVLNIRKQNTKSILASNKDFTFSKDVLESPEFSTHASKILVGKSGRNALGKSLEQLSREGLSEDGQKLPGFNLSTVLSKIGWSEKAQDIAVYFEVGGFRESAKLPDQANDIACVGRISETKFDIDQIDIEKLTEDVLNWSDKNLSNQPKVLCIDLTIRKKDDELINWLKSEKIQKLIHDKKLDIIIWQSEQKQQSLGTGKFASGSAYLLSGDNDSIAKFNKAAEESYENAPDNNLSTFFRTYCADAMHDVVSQQSQSAKIIASEINDTSLFGPQDKCRAVANGSFVILMFYSEDLKQKALNEVNKYWPSSYSFGFSATTATTWDGGSHFIRISVGLETPEMLLANLKKIGSDSNLDIDQNTQKI